MSKLSERETFQLSLGLQRRLIEAARLFRRSKSSIERQALEEWLDRNVPCEGREKDALATT